MTSSYANVPVVVDYQEPALESTQHIPLNPSQTSRPRVVTGLVVLGVVGTLAFVVTPARGPLRGLALGQGSAVLLDDARGLMRVSKHLGEGGAPKCSKLWAQCGGVVYDGPTCCEEGSVCTHTPLLELSSYHQCRRPGEESCGEIVPDSNCAKMIHSLKWDLERTPENFKGLFLGMDDKEYQMYAHWGIWEESHCPEPCADSTCFVVLHIEGCDTLDTWYCSHDDGSLKYACCCKYMHDEKALEKPTDVDSDMAHAIEAVSSNSPLLFCTAMVQPEGDEIWLLREQYAQGKLGLFACDQWAVYSNVSLKLTPEGEQPEIGTRLINVSLNTEVGGKWNTALNTNIFIGFWNAVIADPEVWECDWVVKIDPDAVWLPVRLRALLHTTHGPLGQPEPETGLWLNNCYLGLHGPIEVLSKRALLTYNSSQEACQHGKVSKIGQEDYFIRECFQKLGIQKVDAYNLLLESDFACGEHASAPGDKPPCFSPKVAFHPFKSVNTWMRCHHEAANHPWALPVVPAAEPPSEANAFHA